MKIVYRACKVDRYTDFNLYYGRHGTSRNLDDSFQCDTEEDLVETMRKDFPSSEFMVQKFYQPAK